MTSLAAMAKIATDSVAVQQQRKQIACTTKTCIATSAMPASASDNDHSP